MTDPQLQILLLNIARLLEEAIKQELKCRSFNVGEDFALPLMQKVLDDIKADIERLDHVEMEVGDVKYRRNMDKKDVNDDE